MSQQALIAKWREQARKRRHDSMSKAGRRRIYGICADELEAAFAVSEPPKPTLPVGVSVLVTNGDLVLLGERINNTASGLLSTPGGRVEQNEDIFACAVREALEETGLSLMKNLLKVIAWREHFRFGQHYIMFYVHAPQSFGIIENREPEKCKGWEWRTISGIREEETTEPLDVLALLAASEPGQAGPMGTCDLVSRPHLQSHCGKAWRPLAQPATAGDLLPEHLTEPGQAGTFDAQHEAEEVHRIVHDQCLLQDLEGVTIGWVPEDAIPIIRMALAAAYAAGQAAAPTVAQLSEEQVRRHFYGSGNQVVVFGPDILTREINALLGSQLASTCPVHGRNQWGAEIAARAEAGDLVCTCSQPAERKGDGR